MTLESNLTAAFQAVGGDVGRLNVAARTPISGNVAPSRLVT